MLNDYNDWDWWWGPWRNVIRCGSCRALMNPDNACPVCGTDYRISEPLQIAIDGDVAIYQRVFQGALDWSPYSMLQIMHRDWLRPLPDADDCLLPSEKAPSARVLVVLVFWTYFETLMEWYYATACERLPEAVARDLLNRYGTIGSRLDRLHRILFDTTFGMDLETAGYADIRKHMENLQTQRNAFVHGSPEAITDSLVEETVRLLPRFHEAWITSFNQRCAYPR